MNIKDTNSFTTIEVARLCRVADTTVKRWERAGLLKSIRTSGGHRRFRPEEVARFRREQALGVTRKHGDEAILKFARRAGDKKISSDSALLRALIDGNEEAAGDFCLAAYLRGTPLTQILDRLVCPAMREIGDLWCRGEISVTDEHLATRTVSSLVYKLRSVLPVPEMKNRLAICCAIEQDMHELPTLLAQITIENEGFEVVNFGANTPFYDLAEEVARRAPAFVCVSASFIGDTERLTRDYKQFAEKTTKLGVPVLLAGMAFASENARRRFKSRFYPRDFADVAEIARKLTNDFSAER